MVSTNDMNNVNNVLLESQGLTGEMLSEGLIPALQNAPEERHELQAGLLKMVTKVLGAAQSEARFEEEQTCKRKAEEMEEQLAARKAEADTAAAELQAAQDTVTAKKARLEESREQLSKEEEEHNLLEQADNAKAEEVTEHQTSKATVEGHLSTMTHQGCGEAISEYLTGVKAEPPLVSALSSVLKKAPEDRHDFDDIALAHLRTFLEVKVKQWTGRIEALQAATANIHAETLGAWAIKEIQGRSIQDNIKELGAAEAELTDAKARLKDAEKVGEKAARSLYQAKAELSLAADKCRQCTTALESMAKLEAGIKEEEEEERDESAKEEVSSQGSPVPPAQLEMEMVFPITA